MYTFIKIYRDNVFGGIGIQARHEGKMFPYRLYQGYTTREAEAHYRKEFNLAGIKLRTANPDVFLAAFSD